MQAGGGRRQENLIFFILIIVFVAVVSGCGRKETSQENLTPALSSEEREKTPALSETATSSSEVATSTDESAGKIGEEETLENATDIYNPDPNIDTSDWQVYRNDEIGFEFKYPKNWEIRSNKIDKNGNIDIWLSEKGKWYTYESDSAYENAIIVGTHYVKDINLSSVELLKWRKKEYNSSIQKINIDDVLAYYYNGWGEGVEISNIKNKKFEFSMTSSIILENYAYPEVRIVLQKMIETLKFY